MSSRRAAVKAAFLLAPLFVSILALRAWGDPVSAQLGRAVGHWQYPERTQSTFQIRVPRWRSDAAGLAAKELEEFVTKAVRDHGADLGIRHPEQPVKVVLLDPDTTELKRFGWASAENIKEYEGIFDEAKRTIFLRLERKVVQQPLAAAALKSAAARLLLHDAGSTQGDPWLIEGLTGRVEGTDASELRSWTGELPTLQELLKAPRSDFQGITGPKYVRGAKLLVAYLMERRKGDFLTYYRAVRLPGTTSPREIFKEKFFDTSLLEREWREWIRDPK
jgi:hypothetical protein